MSHHKICLSAAVFKLALLAGTFVAPVSAICGTVKNENLQSAHEVTEINLLNNWTNNTQLIAGSGGRRDGDSEQKPEGSNSGVSGATSGPTSGPNSIQDVRIPDDSNRRHHIFGQAKHKWSQTGLKEEENIQLLEKIANDPSNLVKTKDARGGGKVYIYQGSHDELEIEVIVFDNNRGTRIITDAWVK